METNIKIGDLFIRDYDVNMYEVVGIGKKNLLTINSPLVIKLGAVGDDKNRLIIDCSFKNKILRSIHVDNDDKWSPVTEEELSNIELPENTEIKIKIHYHGDNVLIVNGNKSYLKKNNKIKELIDCDLNRVRRLFYIGFWQKI